MITFIEDDITNTVRGIVAHCVNCKHAMGSGVAKALYTKWPVVRQKYMQHPSGVDVLGTTHIFTVKQDLYVANCYGQDSFGRDGRRYADPDALYACLNGVYMYADALDLPVNIPYKMACGLAGLNWSTEVYPMIQQLDVKYDTSTIIQSNVPLDDVIQCEDTV